MFEPLKVTSIVRETNEVKVFELVDVGGAELPAFEAGSHLELQLPVNMTRHYSLCSDPAERRRYLIAVKRERDSRGGSRYMHESVDIGTVFSDWKVTNAFRFNESASRYIFVAGGIGITPIIAMIARACALGRPFVLHYCARSPAQAPFLNQLTHSDFGEQVFPHYSQHQTRRWEAADAIGERSPGEEIYCCGPAALMDSIRISTAAWPDGTVHFEFFSASKPRFECDSTGFSVEIASSGKVYNIPPDKTILHVLRENGHNVDSSCEAGACGTCRIGYLSGMPDHKDLYLTDDERKESIMVCVSRSKSDRLLLDL